MVGLPGSGKSTLCEVLAERLSVPTFSVGAALRLAAQQRDAQAEHLLLASQPVDIEMFDNLFNVATSVHPTGTTFLLDGSPRTPTQVQYLAEHCDVRAVLLVEAPEHLAVKRLQHRASGRVDDNPATISERVAGQVEALDYTLDACNRLWPVAVLDGSLDVPSLVVAAEAALAS